MVHGSLRRNPFSIKTTFFMRNFAKVTLVVFVISLLKENEIITERLKPSQIFWKTHCKKYN